MTSSISTTSFFRRLSDSLSHRHPAVVKLNLLRLTRVVCDNHPDRATLIHRFNIGKIVDKLAKQDEAILVRELAKEIYPSLLFGNDPPVYHPLTAGALGVSEEGSSPGKPTAGLMKRSTSDFAPVVAPIGVNVPAEKSARESQVKDVLRERPGKEVVRGKSLGVGLGAGMAPPKEILREVKEGKDDDQGKHKRKISRSQLRWVCDSCVRLCQQGLADNRDVHWQADQNGRLKSVRAPPAPL